MILWLLGCSMAPYGEYWPDKTAYPIVGGVEPEVVEGRAGGQTVTIRGRQLSNTTTVVIGGRNAEVVSVDDRAVQVRLPDLPPGPEAVAVSVVTGKGASTAESALRVTTAISDFVENETESVSMLRLDCPVEAWGVYEDGEEYPYGWCGADMGYASAEAWAGVGPQPGFAAETAGILPLSELPARGEVRVLGPGDRMPPSVPLVFSAHGSKEYVELSKTRNFAQDLAFLAERRELLEQTYYWADSITAWRDPVATLVDDEECSLATVDVLNASETSLTLDGDATGASRLILGFEFEEDYGDEVYRDLARVAAVDIEVDSDDSSIVRSTEAGVRMDYDLESGWFLPKGFVGPSEMASGEFVVSTRDAKGTVEDRGFVLGMTPLDLWSTVPDLTMGYWPIARGEPLEVTWEPAPATQSPTVVAVEIAVFDMDVPGPNGLTLVSRLLTSADDTDGSLVISAESLQQLPLAPNRWDASDEATGYWAEMTIARHELRRVRGQDGDIVVDFIHAVNGPVFLE